MMWPMEDYGYAKALPKLLRLPDLVGQGRIVNEEGTSWFEVDSATRTWEVMLWPDTDAPFYVGARRIGSDPWTTFLPELLRTGSIEDCADFLRQRIAEDGDQGA